MITINAKFYNIKELEYLQNLLIVGQRQLCNLGKCDNCETKKLCEDIRTVRFGLDTSLARKKIRKKD